MIGGTVVAVFTAAGLLGCAAALFSALPGASIAERMTVPAELNMSVPHRELLPGLTAVLVVACTTSERWRRQLARSHGL